MWELDYKESWAPKNWCLWTVVLEKTLESPLDCKVIEPVNSKGNQPWILIGRTDAEAKTPIFWSSAANSWFIGKVPDAGKDWGQKEKSQRASLRLNIKKSKTMASRPITAWQIEGAKVEVVTDFLFLGSKITADSDCNHEIRSCLFLGRKAMTNRDSVLKSRDITLLTKVRIVKVMVFPVVTYDSET